MPGNTVLITALAVLVAAFLGIYAVLGSVAGAALVAAGLAVLTVVAGQPIATARQRKQRARQVHKAAVRVAALAGRVTDAPTRAALLRACDTVPRVLERTEKLDPAALSTVSEHLRGGLTGVESALERYLEIQAHPTAYTDAETLLARGREVLCGFEGFTAHAAEQFGAADLTGFFTDLAHLELIFPTRLPPSEER
ncbi:hypothetical protein LTV02_36795 [Nocardia yamanashiensis]|uniref:hypothetical protein n=1 Tax=Nocardia yamanashiensis TaxID=209247 RepID=UPI001E2FD083|nr:hypothetical protein [Nocardia yamanashiensis]UGT41427.1 hypothetical protein LTV02_36795 [Nocardia yamanashiensis]